jgi:hypothetical protein
MLIAWAVAQREQGDFHAEGYRGHLDWVERSVSNAKDQVPLQMSAEFVRTYNAQAPKMVDAIAAAVLGAQAGLNWLRADPPDLKEVRRALDDIVSAGQQAAEIVVRLRTLT